ncbi:alpha-glucuronidase [Cellulomonas cellasea]|uniref:alpha-glucuronidase n=1 Tax=Cellulomonas cellasea TaxID=43670 RepID=UPI0025A44525|nr:alpha-glucuronidase [Cellulomonas cellasea]MDM8086036.1 alpha-glucuronidase [Cellulomonas cellasea]
MTGDAHPAWLPDAAFAPLGRRTVAVLLPEQPAAREPTWDTVLREADRATSAHGGVLLRTLDPQVTGADPLDGPVRGPAPDIVLASTSALTGSHWRPRAASEPLTSPLPRDAFREVRVPGRTIVVATTGSGLLAGLHHLVRQGESVVTDGPGAASDTTHAPALPIRMLDHWDNLGPHPVMGQVERGYAGGSLFFSDGAVREDLSRVAEYARLLGSVGVNRVAVNNVNVHALEARLLTDGLADVARLADVFRAHGIRLHLSVSFAAPMLVGGLPTADPDDPDVRRWWADATAKVYAAVPDFGGYVVKADSEGQPGPFAYGRDHADGANLLARALAPFGGTVFWRAFVYDHRQDWRDRSTDRARAAHDCFAPLDGKFDDNVVLQVKHGPMDFQAREPVSPVLAAMPHTRLAVELQATQEYTGQQRHVCHLHPWWHEILAFRPWGAGRSVADVVAGSALAPGGGVVAVSNVGDDPFWTGHPLAQANLYAFGRLAWDPTLSPERVLAEWAGLAFPGATERVRSTLLDVLGDSWHTYEQYTAPLGVGFMVRPGHHYGPDVDGYEYTPWGTYHFADRDGVGVDRTRATGTGFTGQYPAPWRDVYESPDSCPDELLLFFHHVPYAHVLHSGSTVIQHIYDSRAAGAARVEQMAAAWSELDGAIPAGVFEEVAARLAEQVRSAREWRDQVSAYFFRKSGVPDASGRAIC